MRHQAYKAISDAPRGPGLQAGYHEYNFTTSAARAPASAVCGDKHVASNVRSNSTGDAMGRRLYA